MNNEIKFFSTDSDVKSRETKLGELELHDYVIEDVKEVEEEKDFGDIDHELAESINYLFLKEYRAVLEASESLYKKINNSINIYKTTHNINSKRLDFLRDDKYVDAIFYYASVYNSTPTIIRTLIGYMFLMERLSENPNYLNQSNFEIVVNDLNKDLDILITIVLAEYRGSRLQQMQDRLGELFCIIERDKLKVDLNEIAAKIAFKDKDIPISKDESMFFLFRNKIFSTVLNTNFISNVLDMLPKIMQDNGAFNSDAEKYICMLRILCLVKGNGMPWLEYHCYLNQMYLKMKSTRTPHIIRSIYQNKSDIDSENNRIYAQCACGEILDVTDMMFEFKFINKSTANYETLVKEDKQLLSLALNTDTFNEDGKSNILDLFTNSGYMYQHHITCPRCGRMAMFSKRNNILLQELLKAFLRSEESTSQNVVSEGYATLNPMKIFELDGDADYELRLDLVIDVTDSGVDTNIFGDLDFSDFERVARDFLAKLEKKKTEKELIKGSELQFNYGEVNPNPSSYLQWFEENMYQPEHIQYRDKVYRNFLLWFLKTNYTARFDSEALLMYGINYLYSGQIEEYNKDIVDYNKKLKNLRLSESINKKMLEFIGVYNKNDDPDYQPVYDEGDVDGNKQLFVDINRLNSFVQRALQIEADRCFVNKVESINVDNIHKKFFQLLEDFIDNTNRVSLRLNNNTKLIVFEQVKSVLLTEENIKDWVDVLSGSIKVNDNELSAKLKDILKYVGGKQSDTLLDIDYAGLFAEKPKAPTIAEKPNGSSLMLKLNQTTILNLIIEIGKQEYLANTELSNEVINVDNMKPLFDEIIYGKQDNYDEVDLHNLDSNCIFSLVKNRLSTLIKAYHDTLEKYNAGDTSIDIVKEGMLPQELIYFIDYMLSKVTIQAEYIKPYMQNRLLTEEALNCDIITIKKFKNKIENWYDMSVLDETVKAVITNRLEAQIYYQLKVNIFFGIQDKVYQSGKKKLLSDIYNNFEGIAITLMEALPMQIKRPRCFGGQFSRNWSFQNINPFKKNDKKQVSVEFYCRNGVPDLKVEGLVQSKEKNAKPAKNVIWAFIKMLDTNYFISELFKDYEMNKHYEQDSEMQSLVNNLSAMLTFDKLFSEIYKLPVTEIGEDLRETLEAANCLEFRYADSEKQLYTALVLENNEIAGLEYLLGIRKSLGYVYGKDTLLLNVIDKVQKINLSGTLLPYLVQKR